MNVYHHGILYLTNIMESRNKKSCICWEIASHTKVTDRRCLYRLGIMQLNTQPQTHTSKYTQFAYIGNTQSPGQSHTCTCTKSTCAGTITYTNRHRETMIFNDSQYHHLPHFQHNHNNRCKCPVQWPSQVASS